MCKLNTKIILYIYNYRINYVPRKRAGGSRHGTKAKE